MSNKNNPYRTGIVIVTPPGKVAPDIKGFKPVWVTEEGGENEKLIYIPNEEVNDPKLHLYPLCKISYRDQGDLRKDITVAQFVKNVP